MARERNHLPGITKRNVGASQGPSAPQSRKIHRLQDAVYRQMYLLESYRPGAEMGLALALLRAFVESEHTLNREEFHEWLKSICPLCLRLLEARSKTAGEMRATDLSCE